MKNHIAQMKKAAEDLLAQIDLQTDCMDGHIDRESLDQHMDALEQALDDGVGEMSFHVQELRPEVLAFALLMEARLREKDADKGNGWKGMADFTLATHALAKASAMHVTATRIGEEKKTVKHAVDVANYCMMVADNGGALDSSEDGGAGWPGLNQVQPSPVYDDFMKKGHG